MQDIGGSRFEYYISSPEDILLSKLEWFKINKKGVSALECDVRFREAGEKEEEIDTVVQPGIAIICDPAKIDKIWPFGDWFGNSPIFIPPVSSPD